MLRRVICTTNSIESLSYQLRKVSKNRGRLPSDAAAIKLLWLAIRSIEDKRARQREKGQEPTRQHTQGQGPARGGSGGHHLETTPPATGPGLPGTNQPPTYDTNHLHKHIDRLA